MKYKRCRVTELVQLCSNFVANESEIILYEI